MADYQVLVTDMGGVPYAEIANASIASVKWELNGWGEVVFTTSVYDSQAATHLAEDLQTKREVQIWRNSRLIWWGVYVTASADDKTVTFTCYGLLWYFSRRYFGPVHTNATTPMLINGTFEDATVMNGWAAAAGVTTSGSTSRKRTGSKALKLVTTGSGVTNYYVSQGVVIPTPARSRPLTFTCRGWQYVEAMGSPDGLNRALTVFAANSLGATIDPLEANLSKPDDPLGRWIQREASVTLPVGVGTYIGVALYAPANGTVYWDDVVLTYEQMTGGIEGEDWSDAYLRRIVSYGAGLTGGGGPSASWWGAPNLKSSLNMAWAGTGGPAAGALPADLIWNHADEAEIFSAITELASRNVLDYEVTWAANGRSRSFTTYAPRKGSTKLGLAAENGRNINAFRYDVDGRQLANDVRAAGRGAGKVREEGQGGGPTVASGPQLEAVISPAFELSGQALIDLATSEQGRRAGPVKVPTITVDAGMYMGDGPSGHRSGSPEAGAPLFVGDTIPVRLAVGWVQVAANRRVVTMTLRPADEELDLVVNA